VDAQEEMKPYACLFLLALCACTPIADPYTQADKTGTRLIDGTLRDFYAELNSGNIRIVN
jgi:hypothetical protein